MTINFSKIIGQSVLAVESGEKIAKVKDFVIDPQNGKFLGIFCTQRGLILTIKFFVSANNVKNFGANAVMIENKKVLENPYKNLKVAEVLNSKIEIRGNKAVTESGQFLGEVRDYEVDLNVNKLSHLIVGSGIFREMFRAPLEASAINVSTDDRTSIKNIDKTHILHKFLTGRKELLIPHSQIVSIGRDAIIVRDAAIKLAQEVGAKVPKAGLSPAPG